MATNNKSITVTKAEKAEFLQFWEIHNMPVVFKSKKLIEEQKSEIKTAYCMSGHQTVSCNWEVSLAKPYESSALDMLFKVVDVNGELKDMVDGCISVYYGLKADCSSFVGRTSIDKKTVRKGSEYIVSWIYHDTWTQYMKDPTVTYRIETKFEKSPKTISFVTYQLESVEQNSQNRILERLANLCLSEINSDLKIVTMDGRELPAHSWILKLQNKVFSTMLNADLQEKETGIIKVDDLSGKTMKIILHYLYTGKVLDSWCDTDVAVEFTYAAGKYQLGDVLCFLDKTLGLIENMDLSSCYMQLLSLTNKLDLKHAEARLLEYARNKAFAAKTTAEFFACLGSNL